VPVEGAELGLNATPTYATLLLQFTAFLYESISYPVKSVCSQMLRYSNCSWISKSGSSSLIT
jgi:hypothetical protein